jgi:ATP-dependent RNA helicase RhlE
MRFDELQLAPELVRAVKDRGYEIPTPIQQMAIPEALAGKDVLGRPRRGRERRRHSCCRRCTG